jgi:hypothetical protein
VERVPTKENGVAVENRFLTRAEFHRLADVPPETEWFANLDVVSRMVAEWMKSAGLKGSCHLLRKASS